MTLDLLHDESFLVFTTACGNPDTLKPMSLSSHCVNKPGGCSQTSLLVLTWSSSTFSSSSWSQRLTDIGTRLENKSPCSFIGAFAVKLETISISWTLYTTSSNFWTQFFHPTVFERNLCRRSFWHSAKVLDTFHMNIIQCKIPQQSPIGTLFLGRSFAKLEDLLLDHVGDQLLRLVAECINLWGLIQVPQEKLQGRGGSRNCWINFMTVSLCDSCPIVRLLNGVCTYSVIKVVAPSFPGTLRCAWVVWGCSCLWIKLIL